MEFPDPKPSREEMIETYLQTLARVVARKREATEQHNYLMQANPINLRESAGSLLPQRVCTEVCPVLDSLDKHHL